MSAPTKTSPTSPTPPIAPDDDFESDATQPGPGRAVDASAAGLQTVKPYSARARRIVNILAVVLAVLTLGETAAFLTTYFSYSRYYVSTDNAKVDGDKININATTTGTLMDWDMTAGTDVRLGDIIGRIEATSSKPQISRVLRSPDTGVVALRIAGDREYVQSGQTLAIAYNPDKIYLTARVEDTSVGGIRPGQPVDFTVDAYPGVEMVGFVSQIRAAGAGQFTVYPGTDLDPTNVQKVKQYVPVRVIPSNTQGRQLVPGMSVTVHIRTTP
jgi:multidrug resistance efflux pump